MLANWFGGKDPNHDHEFFATLAVDAKTYFDVYPEISVPPEQLAAWQQDRKGCIVGDTLAERPAPRRGQRAHRGGDEPALAEEVRRLRREHEESLEAHRARAIEEMAGQRTDILGAFPQWRQPYRHHVQAVE